MSHVIARNSYNISKYNINVILVYNNDISCSSIVFSLIKNICITCHFANNVLLANLIDSCVPYSDSCHARSWVMRAGIAPAIFPCISMIQNLLGAYLIELLLTRVCCMLFFWSGEKWHDIRLSGHVSKSYTW